MNHLERLVRRALAVPRDRPQAVFDPFDQTVPWPLEAPAARAVPAEPTLPAERAIAPAAPTLPPPAALSTAVARAQAPTPAAPDAAPALPAPAAIAPSTPIRQRAAPLAAEFAPQARADAFMRALGVAMPQVDAPVAPTRTPATIAAAIDPIAPSSTRRAAESDELPSIRPSRRARAEVAPAPPRPRTPTPPSTPTPPPPAPAAQQRAAAAPPAAQIIRTQPAAARSPALDDLAHGSHIVRFGIGQG